MLLLGPSGIWIFRVEHWSGTIVKQDGTWKQIQTMRVKLGRKRHEEKTHEPGPDDQWLQQKQEIVKTLGEHLPERAWTLDLIQGGVVFSHPKVALDKEHIQGNTASFGPVKSLDRAHPPGPGCRRVHDWKCNWKSWMSWSQVQAVSKSVSAKDEADRLYQQAVEELRAYVAKMVK